MKEAISILTEIDGFIASAVVDSTTGMILWSKAQDNFAIEMAAAANTEVVKAKLRAMSEVGLDHEQIEDILISLSTQYHLIRPLKSNPLIFIYLAVSNKGENLAMSRLKMKKAEESIKSL